MNTPDLQVRTTETGLEVRLHIQPRAKHPGIAGIHNGALKIKVTAPPVDDAANRAVIEFFAALLKIPKSSIQIVSGLKSKDKTLEIKGLSRSDFFARAGLTP